MGLVSKTAKVKWHSTIKKHYEALGYVFTKYGEEFIVRVEDLTKGSETKIECLCDNCKKQLIWSYKNYNKQVREDGKTYCNKCAGKLYGKENMRKTKLKNGKSFYDWCIENNRQEALDRWDYELNGCSPKDVGYSTRRKIWFKCEKYPEHKSELKNINGFASRGEGYIRCKQCNSIAQYILDNFPNKKLEEIWDHDKNTIDPWEISKGSNQKIWIKCQEKDYHGSYETTPDMLSRGVGCPYCNKNSGKVHPLDSLGQYVIDNYGKDFLQTIWSDKNKITPFEISTHNHKKVWWNCPDSEHDTFERNCDNSVRYEFRCPECVKEREESIIEEKTRLYLEELGYEVKTEYKCSLLIRNPKKDIMGRNHILPFDNEIILENRKHLIIEVHGEQHYDYYFHMARRKITKEEAEEELHYQQWKDNYKKDYCIQAGYEYLELPYTAFDKKDTYKKLIDDKIKNILDK